MYAKTLRGLKGNRVTLPPPTCVQSIKQMCILSASEVIQFQQWQHLGWMLFHHQEKFSSSSRLSQLCMGIHITLMSYERQTVIITGHQVFSSLLGLTSKETSKPVLCYWPLMWGDSPHKGPVMGNASPWHYVFMQSAGDWFLNIFYGLIPWHTKCEISLRWMPQYILNDRSNIIDPDLWTYSITIHKTTMS